MRKKRIWNTLIQLIAISSCLVLAMGFGLSIFQIVSPPLSKAETKETITKPTEQKNKKYIVSLGDSLTRGIGDEQGLGYIGIVRKQLEKNKQSFQFANLAISGQTSSQLVQQLKQKQVEQLLAEAKWISMTIGGNDLKNSFKGLEKIDPKQAEKNKKTYEKNLKQILSTIRKQNKEAPIFLFSLYNPYGDLADQQLSSEIVLSWNKTMQDIAATYPDVIIVPTFDLFQLNPKQYLASDHFHPNHLGYQRLAERLMQVIQDTQPGVHS